MDGSLVSSAHVCHAAHNLTCSKLFHQLTRTVNGCLGIIGIKSFFKLAGCIVRRPILLEDRRIFVPSKHAASKSTVFYLICDHGVFAAHDSRNAYRLFAVADHQDVFIHDTFLSVQSYQIFLRFLLCGQ